MTWVLDLDGVVWRGQAAVPGSAEAISLLADSGRRVLYVTNNSALGADGYVEKLGRMDIPAQEADIVHGGHAVSSLVKPGERVLVCAGDGVKEAIDPICDWVDVADVEEGKAEGFDAVVVGIRVDYKFEFLHVAVQAVLAGARLLAPSADPLYPVAHGFQIGGGSIARAISYATGVEPITAGKPFEPIAEATRQRASDIEIVVGDQLHTDGGLAQRLGVPFGLVESGVAHGSGRIATPVDVPVTYQATDLFDLVTRRLASS